MHCLRWWLPVFLLPLPAVSPFLLILFVISYALRTKPCVYCSVIILGLIFSSCSFYQFSPIKNLLSSNQLSTSSIPIDISHVSLQSTVTSSPMPPASEDIITMGKDFTKRSHSSFNVPSSCWIDLSPYKNIQISKMDLGFWSAPTWRRHQSVLSQAQINSDYTSKSQGIDAGKWRRVSKDGIFIGYEDVGFTLKFGLE